MQIINEVTDNKIYTYKGEMIIPCDINTEAGGTCYLSNLILWSPSLHQWKIIFIWCPKKGNNDIKQKGAIHTFLTVGTYSGNYNEQQILTYFLFQR
jgi:hypothetical protein